MSAASAASTPHTSVRSKPPHSAAFHQASRKLATMRLCPVSPCATRIRRSSAARWLLVVRLCSARAKTIHFWKAGRSAGKCLCCPRRSGPPTRRAFGKSRHSRLGRRAAIESGPPQKKCESRFQGDHSGPRRSTSTASHCWLEPATSQKRGLHAQVASQFPVTPSFGHNAAFAQLLNCRRLCKSLSGRVWPPHCRDIVT